MLFLWSPSTSGYFRGVVYVMSFWCQTLPDKNEEWGCFLSDAGVNPGSKSAPSIQQAGRRGRGGAYEIVQVSVLNGALWDPTESIHSKVSCLVSSRLLDCVMAEVWKSRQLHSFSLVQALSLFQCWLYPYRVKFCRGTVLISGPASFTPAKSYFSNTHRR